MTVEYNDSEMIPKIPKESQPFLAQDKDLDDQFGSSPYATGAAPASLEGLPSSPLKATLDGIAGQENAAAASADAATTAAATSTAENKGDPSEAKNPLYLEENLLPISVIAKIAKFAMIPRTANATTSTAAALDVEGNDMEGTSAAAAPTIALSKEAKEALARSCTVFINYLTATAIAHSDKVKAKTIGTEQVFRALKVMEFDNSILDQVKTATSIHSAIQKEKRDAYRKTVKEKKAKEVNSGPADDEMQVDGVNDQEDGDIAGIPQKRAAEEELARDEQ